MGSLPNTPGHASMSTPLDSANMSDADGKRKHRREKKEKKPRKEKKDRREKKKRTDNQLSPSGTMNFKLPTSPNPLSPMSPASSPNSPGSPTSPTSGSPVSPSSQISMSPDVLDSSLLYSPIANDLANEVLIQSREEEMRVQAGLNSIIKQLSDVDTRLLKPMNPTLKERLTKKRAEIAEQMEQKELQLSEIRSRLGPVM
eukprot:TRINITY_DN2774_c1_g1_i1.p1 TRINITY_DN2774_c1_g1~~TRINITY_DN2774_c1_g1_i1.p1  ORF type:complete len:200 (+),score=54.32 TRINITY_DN2774_c1_g1_i1:208-807(+)